MHLHANNYNSGGFEMDVSIGKCCKDYEVIERRNLEREREVKMY